MEKRKQIQNLRILRKYVQFYALFSYGEVMKLREMHDIPFCFGVWAQYLIIVNFYSGAHSKTTQG